MNEKLFVGKTPIGQGIKSISESPSHLLDDEGLTRIEIFHAPENMEGIWEVYDQVCSRRHGYPYYFAAQLIENIHDF